MSSSGAALPPSRPRSLSRRSQAHVSASRSSRPSRSSSTGPWPSRRRSLPASRDATTSAISLARAGALAHARDGDGRRRRRVRGAHRGRRRARRSTRSSLPAAPCRKLRSRARSPSAARPTPSTSRRCSRMRSPRRGREHRLLDPGGAVWGLPVYELALLTASWLEARGRTRRLDHAHDPRGGTARAVRAGGEFRHGRAPRAARDRSFGHEREPSRSVAVSSCSPPERRCRSTGSLRCHGSLGLRLAGLPQTRHGFIPIDRHCRVDGPSRGLRRRRYDDVPGQAGRHRRAAGRRRSPGNRARRRRRCRASAVSPGASRNAPHRIFTTVHAPRPRASRRAARREPRRALVAACEDRRALPRAADPLPRRHGRRSTSRGEGAARGRRRSTSSSIPMPRTPISDTPGRRPSRRSDGATVGDLPTAPLLRRCSGGHARRGRGADAQISTSGPRSSPSTERRSGSSPRATARCLREPRSLERGARSLVDDRPSVHGPGWSRARRLPPP